MDTSKLPLSRMSRDEAPTLAVNVPGTGVQAYFSVSQIDKSRIDRLNITGTVAPCRVKHRHECLRYLDPDSDAKIGISLSLSLSLSLYAPHKPTWATFMAENPRRLRGGSPAIIGKVR